MDLPDRERGHFANGELYGVRSELVARETLPRFRAITAAQNRTAGNSSRTRGMPANLAVPRKFSIESV